jgi:hypothetical protein
MFGFVVLFEQVSIFIVKEGTFGKGYLGGVGQTSARRTEVQ